jgi:hypothetical protein
MSKGREKLKDAWDAWSGLTELDNVKPPSDMILSPRDFLYSTYHLKPVYILALMEHMRKLVYQTIALVTWPDVKPLPEATPWYLFEKFLGLNSNASRELSRHLFLTAHDCAMDGSAWDSRDGPYGPAAKRLIQALVNPMQTSSLEPARIRELMLESFQANLWPKTVELIRNYGLTIVLYEDILFSSIQDLSSLQISPTPDLHVEEEDSLPQNPLHDALKLRHLIYPSHNGGDSGGSSSSRFAPYQSPLIPSFRRPTDSQIEMKMAAQPPFGAPVRISYADNPLNKETYPPQLVDPSSSLVDSGSGLSQGGSNQDLWRPNYPIVEPEAMGSSLTAFASLFTPESTIDLAHNGKVRHPKMHTCLKRLNPCTNSLSCQQELITSYSKRQIQIYRYIRAV